MQKQEKMKNNITNEFNINTAVKEVINTPAFEDFGRLLFPADRNVPLSASLRDISSSDIYVWYSYIRPEKTVDILNYLKREAEDGRRIFYRIYSKEERIADASLNDTGLFFFRGKAGAPYAVTNAGGGFMYVGAMHDSFPHALELSRIGYNAFALIYRPDHAYEDLARALVFIHDHAEELHVDPENYSLWGGSAGARMAAVLGNRNQLHSLTGRRDLPQASAVILQYTGYTQVSAADAPTYACVGTADWIADWRTMQDRLKRLERLGIPAEFHTYRNLPHGFGLGTGTAAEGWIRDAVRFWQGQGIS